MIALLSIGAINATRMRDLQSQLTSLIIFTLNDTHWKNPENKSQIEQGLQALLKASHRLDLANHDETKGDPILPILGPILSDQIQLSLNAFQIGQYDFARQNTRSLTSTCFACHSKEAPSNLKGVLQAPESIMLLPLLDQARYFVALHQYDQALSIYEKIVLNPELPKQDLISWERAKTESLTLLIRVKKKPEEALKLVKTLISMKGTPRFSVKELKAWETDLKDWSQSWNERKNGSPGKTNVRIRFQKALSKRKYPFDHSADMSFLRLTSDLYGLLKNSTKAPEQAEIEFMLGISYETLSIPPYETLHEFFYESCIRHHPHSALSEKCYERYERSVYLGFTGSSGTHIPQTLQNKLLEIWGMALVPALLKR
jgi:tetratricopeptide (TPR) repeat protein